MMPPIATATDQRRRILQASARVFAQRGYDRTSVRHIIGLAGVSRRTFYELFTGKEDVFRVAHGKALLALTGRLALASSARQEWPDRVGAAIPVVLRWAAAEPIQAQLLVGGAFTAGPLAASCHDLLVARFAPCLRAGRGAGGQEISAVRGEAMLVAVAAIIETRLARDDAASLPDLAPELVEFVLAS